MGFYGGQIIYLKNMRFPDDHSIDYRMNGRPYLVYDIKDGNVYLLKISTNRKFTEPSYYFYEMKAQKSNSLNRQSCYVDLRYMIDFDEKELQDLVTKQEFSSKRKFSRKIKRITKKQYEDIKEELETLKKVKELQIISAASLYEKKR